MKEGDICITNNCSACCQDVRVRLTEKERDFLESSGSTLNKVEIPVSLWGYDSGPTEPNDGKATYIMEGQCGNLGSDGLCRAYDNPEKPEICTTTRPRDRGCTSARKEQKLLPISVIEAMVIFELDSTSFF